MQDENIRITNVTYKKVQGEVILKEENISWQPLDRNNNSSLEFLISFDSIRKQQASVDGSKHCLLKLITKDNIQYLLLFNSNQRQKDRDIVKDWISTHVKSTKKRQNPDNLQEQLSSPNKIQKLTNNKNESELSFEEKEFLNKNPELKEVYNQVVGTGIISNEEFWEMNGNPIEQEKPLINEKHQERGIDSTLNNISLKDLLDQSISEGKLKLSLSPELIQNIFVEFPNVEREYKDKVPSQYSKDEFWRNFFKAQYMKYLRQKNPKYKKLVIDPTLIYFSELTSKDNSNDNQYIFQERREYNDNTYLGDDLGGIVEDEHELNPEEHRCKSKNLDLIRKYNRHGTLLVKFSLQNDKITRTDELNRFRNKEEHNTRIINKSQNKVNESSLFFHDSCEISEPEKISIDKQTALNLANHISNWSPKKHLIGQNSTNCPLFKVDSRDINKEEIDKVKKEMKLESQLAQQLLKIFWAHLKGTHDNIQKEKISKIAEKLKEIKSTLINYQFKFSEIGREILTLYLPAIQKSLDTYENVFYNIR